MGLYTIARRRINARPAASDVGRRRPIYRRLQPSLAQLEVLPSPPGIQKRQAAAMATWRLLASMGWRLVAVVALRSYRTEPQEYKRRRLNKCLNPAGH